MSKELEMLIPSDAQLAQLRQHTACDISDALARLSVPGAGHLPDLIPYGPRPMDERPTVAPVSTVLFAAKAQLAGGEPQGAGGDLPPSNNIPPDAHWADLTQAGTFVVLKQPAGQSVAVCGGIMALRMKMRGVRGIIVAGRVRDVAELRETGLPILAHGTSTVGSAGANIPWAVQQPVQVNDVLIRPGDIAFHDPPNGVVVIPRGMLDKVLALLPGIVEADAKVKEDVRKGMSVYGAFKVHRGK